MITEWMDQGNINEFVKKFEGVNRVQLVSPGFIAPGNRCDCAIELVDAATGFEYMHSVNMVHGDLKGVRSLRSLEVQTFTPETRQISSSIRATAPALQISVFQPSSVQITAPELTVPLYLWSQIYLSCRSPLVGLLGG